MACWVAASRFLIGTEDRRSSGE